MDTTKPITEKNEISMADNGIKEIKILRGEIEPYTEFNPYTEDGLSIEAAFEFLSKSEATPEQIKNSYVLYSYEKLSLQSIFDNRGRVGEETKGDVFTGGLVPHPDLEKWGVNKGKRYTNLELADFVKMNRHYFGNKEVAMKLVTELRNLKVKTDREIESQDNKQGDYRFLSAQKVIESNLPKSFILKLPVFVGQAAISFEVEVEVSAQDFGCSLISPDLKEYIDTEAKILIDAQLDKIRVLYPQLRIYQK